jgi:dihydrofolate reductase
VKANLLLPTQDVFIRRLAVKKIVLFVHTSLDGFVAGPQGEMDWITVNAEIFDFVTHLTDNADMALYGRVTYEMMEGYWPTAGIQPGASKHDIDHSKWYSNIPKIVLSRTLAGKQIANTQIISDPIVDEINRLKQGVGKNILIFGSPSASHVLMAEDLIDGYWLFVNPIILGQGIPVFKNVRDKAALKLVESHLFSSGVIALHYLRQ